MLCPHQTVYRHIPSRQYYVHIHPYRQIPSTHSQCYVHLNPSFHQTMSTDNAVPHQSISTDNAMPPSIHIYRQRHAPINPYLQTTPCPHQSIHNIPCWLCHAPPDNAVLPQAVNKHDHVHCPHQDTSAHDGDWPQWLAEDVPQCRRPFHLQLWTSQWQLPCKSDRHQWCTDYRHHPWHP